MSNLANAILVEAWSYGEQPSSMTTRGRDITSHMATSMQPWRCDFLENCMDSGQTNCNYQPLTS
jgi:hypothetical protein